MSPQQILVAFGEFESTVAGSIFLHQFDKCHVACLHVLYDALALRYLSRKINIEDLT